MNIYENNKQLLTTMGGDSANLATDYEVRKAILDLLGGDSSNCNSIYEVDKQILNIYLEGGGGTGGDITLKPITITENGVYTAGVGNGYNEVTVNVEIPECPEIPLTAITITENGTYIPEEGGYNEVIVDVAGGGGGAVGEKVKVSSLKVINDCIVDGTWNANLIDTSNVTDMSSMFFSCTSLQTLDVSNWNTSNVTSMGSMFNGCKLLQKLDVSNWNTSNVTDMSYMFFSCTSLQTLDLSNWDTSNVTKMSSMFSSCTSLQTLDLSNWDTSNVTDMSSMFFSCTSLQTLDLSNWDTSNVTKMSSMFSSCTSLQTLDLSNWDTSNVTKINNLTFSGCNNLTTLIGGRTIEEVIYNNISALNGLKVGISLNNTILDRASLRAIINGLANLTGSSAQTLTLGADLMAKLTEEDIAIATAKNWTIA